ncbi:hypothetical protein Tco_1022170, partial [Tanacetum coccineum]
VLVAPTFCVLAEENLGDSIEIRVDIVHPMPVAAVAFPAAAVVRTLAQHEEIMPPKRTTTPMTDEAIKALIAQGVADALAKMMTDKYCPRGEIKKLEIELWNLNVKGESDEVEKYVGELPDTIEGSVMASNLKTMQDAIEFATELMDQKIRTFTKRQAENKRKLDNNNQAQQQPPKKQNVARAYFDRSSEKKEYAGTLPWCNKCKFHHNDTCNVKCANCKRVSNLTRDCRSPATTNNQRTLTCYECRNQRHYRSDSPKVKNRNHGN